MTTFIYRCPATGYNVQGLLADHQRGTGGNANAFESVTCTACGRVHLVDPKTGKVLGDTRK
jgi:hypothetical protein